MMWRECQTTLMPLLWAKQSIPPHFTCLHLCSMGLCARVVAISTGARHTKHSRCGRRSLMAHAPYQHTYPWSQLHKLSGEQEGERVEFLADLACSRHGYMDQVKTRTTAKADKKGLKRRAGDDPLEATLETASVPATSGAHTLSMEVDAVWGATSALANNILAAIPLLPNEWPLVKIDLILQNTDKYYMSSLYMSSCAFSIRIQLWLLFAPIQLGWWSTLLSFLVNGLSPLWSQLEK